MSKKFKLTLFKSFRTDVVRPYYLHVKVVWLILVKIYRRSLEILNKLPAMFSFWKVTCLQIHVTSPLCIAVPSTHSMSSIWLYKIWRHKYDSTGVLQKVLCPTRAWCVIVKFYDLQDRRGRCRNVIILLWFWVIINFALEYPEL